MTTDPKEVLDKLKWIDELKHVYVAPDVAPELYAALKSALAKIEWLRADKDRLDYLDECNKRLNIYCGTVYRWKLIKNHLVNRLMCKDLAVDLNDADPSGYDSCRRAIDEAMGGKNG